MSNEQNAESLQQLVELLAAEHRNNLDVIEGFEDWQLATLPAWARTALELVNRNSRSALEKFSA